MPKTTQALLTLPPHVQVTLGHLGEHLSIARKRRGESRCVWAARIEISEPTADRMEKGGPAVSIGIYETALWIVGRASEFEALAEAHRP